MTMTMKKTLTRLLLSSSLLAGLMAQAAPARADYETCVARADDALDVCWNRCHREWWLYGYATPRACELDCYDTYQEAEIDCQQHYVESCADYCYDYGQDHGEDWSWDECYGWCRF